jgi:uncharacterized membrane protein (UPF0127 family)
MVKKTFSVKFNGKKYLIKNFIICDSFFSQARGLMFRPKNFRTPLLFIFKKACRDSIHSCFVDGEFLAIWFLDGKIVDKQIVKPWKFSVTPKDKFNLLLEIPLK